MRPLTKKGFDGFDAICLAGVSMIVLGIYMGLCHVKSQRLRHFVRLKHEVSAQVAEMGSVRAALEQEQKKLEKLKTGLELLHDRIPDNLDTDGFLRELNDVATRKNVLIVGVRPGEALERGSYIETPVAVEATAQFRDFYSFVTALRDMPRLATIEDIDIRSEGERSCRVSLILKVYAYRESIDEGRKKDKEKHDSA